MIPVLWSTIVVNATFQDRPGYVSPGQVFTFGRDLGFCGLVRAWPQVKRAEPTRFCPV